MFYIGDKGFIITFANGYNVSVQWGYDNYCSNRWHKSFDTNRWKEEERRLAGEGSVTAEIAIMDKDHNYVGTDLGIFSTDDVEGWCSADRVLEVMNLVAKLPEIP